MLVADIGFFLVLFGTDSSSTTDSFFGQLYAIIGVEVVSVVLLILSGILSFVWSGREWQRWTFVADGTEHVVSILLYRNAKIVIAVDGSTIVEQKSPKWAGLKGDYVVPVNEKEALLKIERGWLPLMAATLSINGFDIVEGSETPIQIPTNGSGTVSQSAKLADNGSPHDGALDIEAEMLRLADLKAKGLIDDDEFKQMKQKVIDKM
jgi:hypothetical protein